MSLVAAAAVVAISGALGASSRQHPALLRYAWQLPSVSCLSRAAAGLHLMKQQLGLVSFCSAAAATSGEERAAGSLLRGCPARALYAVVAGHEVVAAAGATPLDL